jgi:hypothetical protein
LFVSCRDQGTPTASWLRLEPNGRQIRFREHVVYKVLDGRIVEVWSMFDSEAVRSQLSKLISCRCADCLARVEQPARRHLASGALHYDHPRA